MSDYRIEAATKEEWAERALRAEANAMKASNAALLEKRRADKAEAKLERISEEWAGAVYGDLENGVASLNAAAATDFYKRYPSISSFGDTLMGILLEGENRG